MKKQLIFFFFFFSFTALVSSSYFSPTDHYLVSCGSRDPTIVDFDHRRFTGDASKSAASQFLTAPSPGRSIELVDPNPAPNSSPLYRTARAFTKPSRYAFAIQETGVHHLVRLHFHRFTNSSVLESSTPQFHVLANGFLLLNNFSLGNEKKDVVVKEFILRVDSDKLEITFVPAERSNFYAFVNAIEVISSPKDLITDLAQFVNSERNERIDGMLKSSFETLYRVNVGGPKVTPFNDSLWRTWVSDDSYLEKSGENGATTLGDVIRSSGRIQYQAGGASREVGPDNVYNSARVIKSLNDSVPKSNITWVFPGINESGSKYLVRLHFCDIASIGPFSLYFNVYVNGNLAYENLDLTLITNSLLASPFYADFVIDGSSSSSGSLTVSVGPSNFSLPHAVDALLNGVEVFKMSSSFGSFQGEMCAESVMRSWRRGNVGVVLPLLAAVFLLLTASVIVQRKRCGVAGDTIGWSRLPVDVSEVNLKHPGLQSTTAGKL
ncbi:OLC1v1000163C1 [Oldenlandia corymbosa var. corymbosa]|uniref:OLC1v1000163C1 n=1 Tax=Oldenlandia corymbosa var. corymbosa TaxID=529605 RepID=A0AAV1D509_OLDCO|nr:OLC1v1000163C1 [Oldenlandia corymbosa var. corymbosa]